MKFVFVERDVISEIREDTLDIDETIIYKLSDSVSVFKATVSLGTNVLFLENSNRHYNLVLDHNGGFRKVYKNYSDDYYNETNVLVDINTREILGTINVELFEDLILLVEIKNIKGGNTDDECTND